MLPLFEAALELFELALCFLGEISLEVIFLGVF